MTSSNAIAHIRANLFGVNQTEFAHIAGVGQATVSRWENGETCPTLAELKSIREAAICRHLDWNDGLLFTTDLAAVAPAAPIEDETHFLIARHALAFAEFLRAIPLTDEVEAKQDGRAVDPEDVAKKDALDGAETVAFLALVEHTPHNVSELRRKAQYLLFHLADNDEPDLLIPLLQSLTRFTARPYGA